MTIPFHFKNMTTNGYRTAFIASVAFVGGVFVGQQWEARKRPGISVSSDGIRIGSSFELTDNCFRFGGLSVSDSGVFYNGRRIDK